PAFSPILMSFISLVTAISTVSIMSLWYLLKKNSRDAQAMKQRGFYLHRLVLMYAGEFLVFVPFVFIGSVLVSAAMGLVFFSRLIDVSTEQWSMILRSAMQYSLIIAFTFCIFISMAVLFGSYLSYSALPSIKLRASNVGIKASIRTMVTIWTPGILVSLLLIYGLRESLSSGNFAEFNLRRDILVYSSPAAILVLVGLFGVMASRVVYGGTSNVLGRMSGYSPLFAALTRLSRNVGLSGWPIFLTATIVGIISFSNVVSNDLEKRFSYLSESLVGSDVRIKGFRDTHNVIEYADNIESLDNVEAVSVLFESDNSFLHGKAKDFKVVALNPEGMRKVIGNGKGFRPADPISDLGRKTVPELLAPSNQGPTIVEIEGRLSGGSPPLRLTLMTRESPGNKIIPVEVGTLYSTDWVTLTAELDSMPSSSRIRLDGIKLDLLSSLTGIEGNVDIRRIDITSSESVEDLLLGDDGQLRWGPVPKGHELSLSKLSHRHQENHLENYLTYSFVKKDKGADTGIYLTGGGDSLSVLASERFRNAHGIINSDPISITVLNRELKVVPVGRISRMPGVSDSSNGFLLADLDQFMTHINSWDKRDKGKVRPTDIIVKLRKHDGVIDTSTLREHLPEGTEVITKSSSLTQLSPFAVLQMKGWRTQLILSLVIGLAILAIFTVLHDSRDRSGSRGDNYVLKALGVNSARLVRQKIYETSINSLIGIGLGLLSGYVLSLIVLPAIMGKLGLNGEYLTLGGFQDYWLSLGLLAVTCIFINVASAFFSSTSRFKKSPQSPYRFDDEG
ncbi:MAG: ABC transporter permease, partial [Chloroflexota bacterium]|nr:ABC transporter permease [Chloroflexota bacterium]